MTNAASPLLVKPIHLVPSSARMTTPLAKRLREALRGDVLFDAWATSAADDTELTGGSGCLT